MSDVEEGASEHHETTDETHTSETLADIGKDIRRPTYAPETSPPTGVIINRPVIEGRLTAPQVSQPEQTFYIKPFDHVDTADMVETSVIEPRPGDDPQVTVESFQAREADRDLNEARQEIHESKEALNKLSGSNKAKVAGVIAETDTLDRLLKAINELLSKGQPVPPGLAVSVTVRVELVQEAARQTADHADKDLQVTLKQVLEKTRMAGQKLLSMNLHLFPVKEWQLGGEVSALFVKGTISVTFGSGTSQVGAGQASDNG
jgi:hypothetical protein